MHEITAWCEIAIWALNSAHIKKLTKTHHHFFKVGPVFFNFLSKHSLGLKSRSDGPQFFHIQYFHDFVPLKSKAILFKIPNFQPKLNFFEISKDNMVKNPERIMAS